MGSFEQFMLTVHERLRSAAEAPRYMHAEGEDSALPPQLRDGRRQVKRVVGRHTITTYKE